jgi:YidC/Oxa1 family membrane protein insertase
MRNRIRRHNPNNSQSNLIPTIVISSVIVVIWGYLFPPAPAVNQTSNQTPQVIQSTQDASSNPSKVFDQLSVNSVISGMNLPIKELHTFDLSPHQRLSVNSAGQINTVALLEEQYKRTQKSADGKETKVDEILVTTEDHSALGDFVNPLLDVYINGSKVEGAYQVQSVSDKEVTLVLNHSLAEVTRVFTPHADRYNINEKISVKNLASSNAQVKIMGLARGLQNLNKTEASMFSPALNTLNALCDQNGDLEREAYTSIQDLIADQDPTQFNQIRWFGIENQYFMTALSSATPWKSCQLQVGYQSAQIKQMRTGFDALSVSGVLFEDFVAPSTVVSQSVDFFVGPKKSESLRNNEPSLGDAINFGIFSPLCYPMLWFMRTAYDVIPNWGIAIILLTIFVKLLTYPINAKQYESMNKMKALQPEMEEIKAKYQDKEPLKLQEETMALYKKHNVNPAAGCLPLFLMMPVYMALYSTVGQAVELYQAPFFGWIQDLSASDPYLITPILLAMIMFVQAKLQPTTVSDPTQKFMFTYFMPGFFGMMMLFLPSGLVLYILINTVLGIVQQKWMNTSASQPTTIKAKA